jgi:L-aspartate semialdehyde sulfurtransferase ferredoxin
VATRVARAARRRRFSVFTFRFSFRGDYDSPQLLLPESPVPDKADYAKRCWFTFPSSQQVEQPIIWQMSQRFPNVVFDIRQASVHHAIGIMAVLLVGTEADVNAAIVFVRSKGVTVEPIEKSVVEG